MKLIVITIGFALASLLCAAQSTSTGSLESTRFLICHNGESLCKIAGLASTNSTARQHQEITESVARRLQTYFYLLSGCRIPIENADPTPPERKMRYTVNVSVGGGEESGPPYANVNLIRDSRLYATPSLNIEDQERVNRLRREQDGSLTHIQHPRLLLTQALDAFGQKYFGVPVSAIDDTNFNWSTHHTNTLAISYADFQPIGFSPGYPKDWTQAK